MDSYNYPDPGTQEHELLRAKGVLFDKLIRKERTEVEENIMVALSKDDGVRAMFCKHYAWKEVIDGKEGK